MTPSGRPRGWGIEALTASVGMVLFALTSHQGWGPRLVGAGGLLVTAWAIHRGCPTAGSALETAGLAHRSPREAALLPVGLAVGFSLGLLYRWAMKTSLLPSLDLRWFAALACLIGAAEEVLYRGWLQGRLRALGAPLAVLCAALSHAAYKTALFAWTPEPAQINLLTIGLITAGAGLIFGTLREASRSVLPPVGAHAAFDLLVYWGVGAAPWWVWT